MDLHVGQVRSAVRNSGKCPGVEYWVGRPAPDALQTATVWMNLPEETRETTANFCTKLQAAPWFDSLRAGDQPGIVGMTVWGPAPVCDEIRRKLALELGTEVRQPRTLIRVYGYGPSTGLNACDENSYAQRELRRVWPMQDVKMVNCQHLSRSGLQRPTFSRTLEGVPPDSEQAILKETDARPQHSQEWRGPTPRNGHRPPTQTHYQTPAKGDTRSPNQDGPAPGRSQEQRHRQHPHLSQPGAAEYHTHKHNHRTAQHHTYVSPSRPQQARGPGHQRDTRPAHGGCKPQPGACQAGAMEIPAERGRQQRGRGHEQRERGLGQWCAVVLAILCTLMMVHSDCRSVLYDPVCMLLARSGDIHLHLGPLVVESANVTSLKRHWR